MISYPNRQIAHQEIDHIFQDLFPRHDMVARPGQIELSHKMLDAMTVYKDRREYPHKLENAIEAYGLHGQNTHRAIDDARATLELLDAMASEEDDILHYVNLFGYNPKYGVSGPRISSVTYRPQSLFPKGKLYENF